MVPSESPAVKIAKSEEGGEPEPCLAFISAVLRAGCESLALSPYAAKCIFDGVKATAPIKALGNNSDTIPASLPVPVFSRGAGKMCREMSADAFDLSLLFFVTETF